MIKEEKDTERRKQEEESKSLLGKEWYKGVHESSNRQHKAFMIRHEGLMMRRHPQVHKKLSPKSNNSGGGGTS